MVATRRLGGDIVSERVPRLMETNTAQNETDCSLRCRPRAYRLRRTRAQRAAGCSSHDRLFIGFPFPTCQFFAVRPERIWTVSSLSVAGSLGTIVRLPVHPGEVLFIIPKMNSERMQALPKSHFCSFESQRHHRDALSGLSHFPKLVVLLGFPYSSGVLCT